MPMSEGQESSWFDEACRQLTEVIPIIGTRSADVLAKLAEVVPKVGRTCDHVSVFLSKLTDRLDKPVEVRFDQAQLKQAVDDYGEMIATVAEVAVLRVDGKLSTPSYTVVSERHDTDIQDISRPPPVPVVAEVATQVPPDHPVVHAAKALEPIMGVSPTQVSEDKTTPVTLVDLSVLNPKGDCADCTAIGMLCDVHVKDTAIVEEAAMQVSSWLDDRDADGSLGKEPIARHFKRLDFATKALGDKCDRDCMSCARVTDAGIPRPVQCLRDVAKLVPAVSS